MSRRSERAIGWALALITLAVYGVMVGVYGRQLIALAEGALPFDVRIQGYGLADVRSYLRALSPEGFALYEGPVRQLDTAFPVLLGLCLAWWMRPYGGVFGMTCVLAVMSYVTLDLGENAFVARMLTAGPDWVTLPDITRASALTQGKFAALALCAVLVLRQSVRRWRGVY